MQPGRQVPIFQAADCGVRREISHRKNRDVCRVHFKLLRSCCCSSVIGESYVLGYFIFYVLTVYLSFFFVVAYSYAVEDLFIFKMVDSETKVCVCVCEDDLPLHPTPPLFLNDNLERKGFS